MSCVFDYPPTYLVHWLVNILIGIHLLLGLFWGEGGMNIDDLKFQ